MPEVQQSMSGSLAPPCLCAMRSLTAPDPLAAMGYALTIKVIRVGLSLYKQQVPRRHCNRNPVTYLPEDGVSVLDGDGDVVLATSGDGRRLTLPEQQRVVSLRRHRQANDLLARVARVWEQLARQLDVAALAGELRLRRD